MLKVRYDGMISAKISLQASISALLAHMLLLWESVKVNVNLYSASS